MRRKSGILSSLFFAAALAAPVVIVGCAGRLTVADEWHGDRHRWDSHEDVVFRAYLTENHREYRPFDRLSRDEQRAYFDWRHAHPER
jgi:hypothetical protein